MNAEGQLFERTRHFSETMRIGVNGRTFSVDEPRGSVQASIEFVRALAERPETDVVVFAHKSAREHFRDINVVAPWSAPRSQSLGLVWEQSELPRLATRQDIDLLLCPNSDGPVRRLDVPTIVRLHDVFGYVGYGPRLYTLLQQFRVPRMVDVADLLLTPSRYTASTIRSRLDADTPTEVVHNGLDEMYHDVGDGRPVDLPENFALYVGGNEPRKNVATLVEGFAEFRSALCMDYELVTVGPKARYIENSNGQTLSGDAVKVLGYLTPQELLFVYQQADVFLFPSLEEGFGLPPLEAMACRTPVISANRPAMTELLNEYVEFVDPTDPSDIAHCLAETLQSPPDDDALDRAREYATSFDWGRAAADTVETLEQHFGFGEGRGSVR
ncbi:glycosyltransferase family 1 protein [Haloarcula sp. JP-L23]|uniref:glycosyltransferase family 4 protein n=1 Tax=Haloarcula sp. JP-L23 TaxID=2716717 RepID=UPI00140EAAC5|nr:glycosyltransferase family 4 protein [Haloarcula sp. JP-L23]